MYYLLETDYFAAPEPYRTRLVSEDMSYQPSKWMRGRTMSMPTFPLDVELWERGGDGLAELFLDSVPLFRDDLVDCLVSAGVDNLQIAPVILRDRAKGLEVTNYRVVNIVGCIACADMTKSEYTDVGGVGKIAVAFRKLVIDEKAAGGAPFFRLGESVASIVVHERIQRRVAEAAFNYLSWRRLEGA